MGEVPGPFAHSIGPKTAKIVFVGEAWGEREDRFKCPLVGWTGVELARMLSEAHLTKPFAFPQKTAMEPFMISWWQSTGFFFTNVFAERPPMNKLEYWTVKKAGLPDGYNLAYYRPGQYFAPEKIPHIHRLYEEIRTIRPNLVVALGAIATWALLGNSAISKVRGAVAWSNEVSCKVLPTYHPASLFRGATAWTNRVVILQDLFKAKREVAFPEIRRPERWVLVNPTLEDIREWMCRPATHYAVDIETTHGQISMIGFARSPQDAIVIPFLNGIKAYWSSHEEEVRAWKLVAELLNSDKVKIFQNGLYDLSYIVRMGLKVKNCTEDLMLLHHALFPELPKGLGFLGSIYTDEASWKLMRHHGKDEVEKREE